MLISSNDLTLGRLQRVVTNLATFLTRNEVAAVFVGGSYSRGEYSEFSDIDLTIIVKSGSRFGRYVLGRQMSKFLGHYFGMNISTGVVTMHEIASDRTIEMFDLATNGICLWGDAKLIAPRQIPKWEGFRLIFNRLLEYLFDNLEGAERRSYLLAKLFIALGDAGFLFERGLFEARIRRKMLPMFLMKDSDFFRAWTNSMNYIVSRDPFSPNRELVISAVNQCLIQGLQSLGSDDSSVEGFLGHAAKTLFANTSVPRLLARVPLCRNPIILSAVMSRQHPAVLAWIHGLRFLNTFERKERIFATSLWRCSPQPIISNDGVLGRS